MKTENTNENQRGERAVTEHTVVYGETEEAVVKFLRNQLRCMEEEYGIRIFLENRMAGEGASRHLCINYDSVEKEKRAEVMQIMEPLIPALLTYGQQQYIEQQLSRKKLRMKDDPLTGVFSREYLINRADVITRAEIYPTTVIAVRLKGLQGVTASYGRESGDSLLQLTAFLLAGAADSDYLIGRMTEDVFVVLIPLVREGEKETFCEKIKAACSVYEDSVISLQLEIGVTETQMKFEDLTEKMEEAIGMVAE